MDQTVRKPDFFIVGAPKCGTTAMADYLGQHPEIFMPEVKDSMFFGADLRCRPSFVNPPDRFRVDIETYLSWFDKVENEKRVGEASVMYLYSKCAPIEIKEFNPDASIIVMLRNPIDTIPSLHGHCFYMLNEDIEDLAEALAAESDRKQGRRIPDTAYILDVLLYRDIVRYTDQLKRYYNVFGRMAVHVILFDDFRRDAAGVYRNTLRFLGVDDGFQASLEPVNMGKRPRSKRMMRLVASPPVFLRPLARILAARDNPVRRLVKRAVMRFNTVYEKRSPIDPDLRKQLQREFAPEVQRLGDLLERDLRHWLT
jgi:hypothetical protein